MFHEECLFECDSSSWSLLFSHSLWFHCYEEIKEDDGYHEDAVDKTDPSMVTTVSAHVDLRHLRG